VEFHAHRGHRVEIDEVAPRPPPLRGE
jgi:hypothetical protein